MVEAGVVEASLVEASLVEASLVEASLVEASVVEVLVRDANAPVRDVDGAYFDITEEKTERQPLIMSKFSDPGGRYLPHDVLTDDMTSFKVNTEPDTLQE